MNKAIIHPRKRERIVCPICGSELRPPTRHSCGGSKETEMRAPITGAQPDILDEESDQAYAEALSAWDDLTEEEQDALRTYKPSHNNERKILEMAAYVPSTQNQTPATAFDYTKHLHILASLLIHAAENARETQASNQVIRAGKYGPSTPIFPETLEDAIAEAVRETAFIISRADVEKMGDVLASLGEALKQKCGREVA